MVGLARVRLESLTYNLRTVLRAIKINTSPTRFCERFVVRWRGYVERNSFRCLEIANDLQNVSMAKSPLHSRWLIALAGTALQLCLGTVYAWSYFQKPLVEAYGWSNAQVAWTFSLAICCLGIAAAWGGLQLPRLGPRRLAMIGGVLFGAGHLVAALALRWKCLPLLYLGYGVLGGFGLGLSYVTPVATVAKWFPDKKGLTTGMVIMGFGFGALLMSKLFAPLLYRASGGDLVMVFAWLGIGFLPTAVALGALLRNPPPGFAPATHANPKRPLGTEPGNPGPSEAVQVWPGLFSRRFAAMWLVFFANILAGISLISFQSPLFQDLWHNRDPDLSKEALAACGATLIAVTSLFNGAGRMLWGGLSDRIGRVRTFRIMLASQVAVFVVLTQVGNPWLFAALLCYILLCYGGGFGTMPSFVLDVFGPAQMPLVYGAILTAWSAAGIAGPQLVAFINDHYAAQLAHYAFTCNAAVLSLGLALTGVLRDGR
jgi:OFA family oxalate/formate antiporter-like MFS transporter